MFKFLIECLSEILIGFLVGFFRIEFFLKCLQNLSNFWDVPFKFLIIRDNVKIFIFEKFENVCKGLSSFWNVSVKFLATTENIEDIFEKQLVLTSFQSSTGRLPYHFFSTDFAG